MCGKVVDEQPGITHTRRSAEPVAGEVLDFVRFLKSKNGAEPLETALASEAVLGKDWLRPEEDEAWRDL
jgi:hypothetical protein